MRPHPALLALAALACGADVSGACDAYVAAWKDCIDVAYDANETDKQTLLEAANATCEDYAELKDKKTEDLLNCFADVYTNADCSDPAGYAQAGEALADCG